MLYSIYSSNNTLQLKNFGRIHFQKQSKMFLGCIDYFKLLLNAIYFGLLDQVIKQSKTALNIGIFNRKSQRHWPTLYFFWSENIQIFLQMRQCQSSLLVSFYFRYKLCSCSKGGVYMLLLWTNLFQFGNVWWETTTKQVFTVSSSKSSSMKTVLFNGMYKLAKRRLEEWNRYDIPPWSFNENQKMPE